MMYSIREFIAANPKPDGSRWTRAWVLQRIKMGMIPGAVRQFGIWTVPKNATMPKPMKPGRKKSAPGAV